MLSDLEKSCSAIWRNRVWRFGEIVFDDFGEIVFGDLEKSCSAILEKPCLAILEKSCSAILEKSCSAITLEIWRNMVGTVMAITYWSSIRSSIELGDREWMLNHNRDKMETSYGDQNFTKYKIGEYISGVLETYKVFDVPRVGNIDSF